MKVDIIFYTACINACEVTAWQEAFGILDVAKLNGLQLSLITLNSASSVSAKAHRPWTCAFTLLNDLHGLRADVISYNSAMSSCPQWQQALQLLHVQMSAVGSVDLIGYNSAISAADATAWPHALQILASLDGNATAVSFGATMGVLEAAGQWLRALVLLDSAKMLGLANGITYQAAIGACGNAQMWQQALQLLWDLEALEGAKLSLEMACSGAIRACGQAGRWEMALLLLETLGNGFIMFFNMDHLMTLKKSKPTL